MMAEFGINEKSEKKINTHEDNSQKNESRSDFDVMISKLSSEQKEKAREVMAKKPEFFDSQNAEWTIEQIMKGTIDDYINNSSVSEPAYVSMMRGLNTLGIKEMTPSSLYIKNPQLFYALMEAGRMKHPNATDILDEKKVWEDAFQIAGIRFRWEDINIHKFEEMKKRHEDLEKSAEKMKSSLIQKKPGEITLQDIKDMDPKVLETLLGHLGQDSKEWKAFFEEFMPKWKDSFVLKMGEEKVGLDKTKQALGEIVAAKAKNYSKITPYGIYNVEPNLFKALYSFLGNNKVKWQEFFRQYVGEDAYRKLDFSPVNLGEVERKKAEDRVLKNQSGRLKALISLVESREGSGGKITPESIYKYGRKYGINVYGAIEGVIGNNPYKWNRMFRKFLPNYQGRFSFVSVNKGIIDKELRDSETLNRMGVSLRGLIDSKGPGSITTKSIYKYAPGLFQKLQNVLGNSSDSWNKFFRNNVGGSYADRFQYISFSKEQVNKEKKVSALNNVAGAKFLNLVNNLNKTPVTMTDVKDSDPALYFQLITVLREDRDMWNQFLEKSLGQSTRGKFDFTSSIDKYENLDITSKFAYLEDVIDKMQIDMQKMQIPTVLTPQFFYDNFPEEYQKINFEIKNQKKQWEVFISEFFPNLEKRFLWKPIDINKNIDTEQNQETYKSEDWEEDIKEEDRPVLDTYSDLLTAEIDKKINFNEEKISIQKLENENKALIANIRDIIGDDDIKIKKYIQSLLDKKEFTEEEMDRIDYDFNSDEDDEINKEVFKILEYRLHTVLIDLFREKDNPSLEDLYDRDRELFSELEEYFAQNNTNILQYIDSHYPQFKGRIEQGDIKIEEDNQNISQNDIFGEDQHREYEEEQEKTKGAVAELFVEDEKDMEQNEGTTKDTGPLEQESVDMHLTSDQTEEEMPNAEDVVLDRKKEDVQEEATQQNENQEFQDESDNIEPEGYEKDAYQENANKEETREQESFAEYIDQNSEEEEPVEEMKNEEEDKENTGNEYDENGEEMIQEDKEELDQNIPTMEDQEEDNDVNEKQEEVEDFDEVIEDEQQDEDNVQEDENNGAIMEQEDEVMDKEEADEQTDDAEEESGVKLTLEEKVIKNEEEENKSESEEDISGDNFYVNENISQADNTEEEIMEDIEEENIAGQETMDETGEDHPADDEEQIAEEKSVQSSEKLEYKELSLQEEVDENQNLEEVMENDVDSLEADMAEEGLQDEIIEGVGSQDKETEFQDQKKDEFRDIEIDREVFKEENIEDSSNREEQHLDMEEESVEELLAEADSILEEDNYIDAIEAEDQSKEEIKDVEEDIKDKNKDQHQNTNIQLEKDIFEEKNSIKEEEKEESDIEWKEASNESVETIDEEMVDSLSKDNETEGVVIKEDQEKEQEREQWLEVGSEDETLLVEDKSEDFGGKKLDIREDKEIKEHEIDKGYQSTDEEVQNEREVITEKQEQKEPEEQIIKKSEEILGKENVAEKDEIEERQMKEEKQIEQITAEQEKSDEQKIEEIKDDIKGNIRELKESDQARLLRDVPRLYASIQQSLNNDPEKIKKFITDYINSVKHKYYDETTLDRDMENNRREAFIDRREERFVEEGVEESFEEKDKDKERNDEKETQKKVSKNLQDVISQCIDGIPTQHKLEKLGRDIWLPPQVLEKDVSNEDEIYSNFMSHSEKLFLIGGTISSIKVRISNYSEYLHSANCDLKFGMTYSMSDNADDLHLWQFQIKANMLCQN